MSGSTRDFMIPIKESTLVKLRYMLQYLGTCLYFPFSLFNQLFYSFADTLRSRIRYLKAAKKSRSLETGLQR